MFKASTPKEVADRLTRFHKDALAGIIAIDGKDGAGKDCLAINLQKLVGGGIVSLDCFIRKKNQGGLCAVSRSSCHPNSNRRVCHTQNNSGMLHATGSQFYWAQADVLIYAKKVMLYPDGINYNWLDDEVLFHQNTVSENDTVTKEIIHYHDRFKPLQTATIEFLHTYKRYHCPFHL